MKAICIDDEKLALQFMEHLLQDIDVIDFIGSFQNPKEALAFLLKEDIDVVFLDIHMPEIDGLELAEIIIEKRPQIDIVFVTAYNEYAVNAFEINAIDYLLKPVKFDRLKKTVKRVQENRQLSKTETVEEDPFYIRLGHNLSFSLDNKEYKPLKWRTSKARELFLYLLQNSNKVVHKALIMDLLWGEDEFNRGFSILYTTVYNVRKTLQPFDKQIKLQNANDGYILRLYNVKLDLVEWEEKIVRLPDVDGSSIQQYEEIMKLNSGPYLDDYDYIWVESEKQRLENIWLQIAQDMARFYEDENYSKEAIHWYRTIVERTPEIEEAHLQLMKLYAAEKNQSLVTKQYEEYIDAQESFDLKPSKKMTDWYEDYLQKV